MKKLKSLKSVCSVVLCFFLMAGLIPMHAEAAKNKVDLTYVNQVFDAEYYYNRYSDVANVFGMNPQKLLNHYVTYGIYEGRNASANFNATTYKNNYEDLRNAYGSDMISYCNHYAIYGIPEGRSGLNESGDPVADLYDIRETVIATYTTKFSVSVPRAINVKLAASQVNGKVIEPNETFSFLGSITPRTLENGYVMAPVFSGGKESVGIGGGICQVSSTIYAAILGTRCSVVERHAHSLPVSYVPKGMDATVSAPALDFRFTNTYDQPMVIRIEATEKGKLTVSIALQQK